MTLHRFLLEFELLYLVEVKLISPTFQLLDFAFYSCDLHRFEHVYFINLPTNFFVCCIDLVRDV